MNDDKVSMVDVLKDRSFMVLWWSMLLSTSSTFLLLLAVSSAVFEQTGSSFKSSSIFSIHWLLPVVLFPVIGHISSNFSSRNVLMGGEIVSALLSIAAGLVFNSFFVGLYGIFLIRGFFESLSKTTRTVALKNSIDPKKLEIASSLFNTSYYLGIGLGSIGGALVLTFMSIKMTGFICGFIFLISGLLYRNLPENDPQVKKMNKSFSSQWKATFKIASDQGIIPYLIFLGMVVAGFQGFHNVARNIYPMEILGFGISGTGYLQAVNTIGILFGAIFVSKFLLRSSRLPQSPSFLIVITSLSLLPIAYVNKPFWGLMFYFVFAFLFEVAFTKIQNEIILRCPKEHIGLLSAFNHSVIVGSMMVAVFVMGAAVDAVGFSFLTISLIVVMGLSVMILHLLRFRSKNGVVQNA